MRKKIGRKSSEIQNERGTEGKTESQEGLHRHAGESKKKEEEARSGIRMKRINGVKWKKRGKGADSVSSNWWIQTAGV